MDIEGMLLNPESLKSALDKGEFYVDKKGEMQDSNGFCYDICACVLLQHIPVETVRLLLKHKFKFLDCCQNCEKNQLPIVSVLLEYMEKLQ